MPVEFRPLLETDLPDLLQWLNRPHLRRFFQKQPITSAEIDAKYGARIRGEQPTHCHLALTDGHTFGYAQCYRVADWPEWAATTNLSQGISVDLAIFEFHLIGRGLGRAMLAKYVREVAFPLFPVETQCFIAHELDNISAIACSKAVGFEFVRMFEEEGIQNALFVIDRLKPMLAETPSSADAASP